VKTIRSFKWRFFLFAAVAGAAVALILRCAVPNEPPLRWLSKVEVPMTNDSFKLAQNLSDLISGFNDTIVQYWYRSDSVPHMPDPAFSHPRYYATVGAVDTNVDTSKHPHITVTWQKNHVYRFKGYNQWEDKGALTGDILMGGYDTANLGIRYSESDQPDLFTPDLFYPDYKKGDTVVLSIRQADSVSYAVNHDTMEDKYFHPSIGLISVANAPIISDTFPRTALPPLPVGTFGPISFNVILVKTPGGNDTLIEKIIFDTSSPQISVKVKNLSATATITNLSIKMIDSTRTVLTLLPLDSTTLSFPVAGSGIIGANLPVQIGGTCSDNTARIALDENSNGAIADEVRIRGSLIQSYSNTYINDYELTDTLNVQYIDIQQGSFYYYLSNYTQMRFGVFAQQLHLWNTSECERRHVDSAADIGVAFTTWADSNLNNFYFGHLTQVGANIQPDTTELLQSVNLAATRLFPLWNPALGTSGKSVSRVVYTITADPPDPSALYTLKDNDSLTFVIRARGFHFKEMLATVTKAYVRGGDTAKIAVPFPFNKDSRDSLKGKFILKQVMTDIFLTPKLPDSAFLDSLNIHFSLFAPNYAGLPISNDTQFTHVVNNKTSRVPVNITSIIKDWPDSMYVMEDVKVPVGTKILAVNEQKFGDTDYTQYQGKMNIRTITKTRTNIMLGWEVNSAAKLDLGIGSFKVSKSLKSFNRLENALAYLNMNFYNHSNVYMNLYALAAPAPHMRALDNMPLDSVLLLVGDTAKAHQLGYIDLLGTRGIGIPARGHRDTSNVVLQQWETDSMLKYDSCGWRWEATFLPMSADTLRDTDYVFIQSYVHMEGVNNMDSLINQK
jgi:hypothetical protein